MNKVKDYLNEACKIYLGDQNSEWKTVSRDYNHIVLANIINIADMLQREHNG